MSAKDRPIIVSGHAEIWLRLSQNPGNAVLRSESDIVEADYAHWGGIIPLVEFQRPYDIYTAYNKHGLEFGLPRNVGEYDLINLFYKKPQPGALALLVVDLDRSKHLVYPGCKIQMRAAFKHALIPLRKAFKSSAAGAKKR